MRNLQAALMNPDEGFYEVSSRRLSDELIAPLLSGLDSKVNSLIYSTDSNFADIPLGVLPFKNRFLVQRFSITRIPSLKLLKLADEPHLKNAMSGISCVDPEIPSARLVFQRETNRELKKLYGDKLNSLEGQACSASKLEQAIREAKTPSFLHVGAHGVFYSTESMSSGLLLAKGQKGELNRGEVWDARAIGAIDMSSIDLVTIASRGAALTDKSLRRDLFGLMRTLLFGGVNSVLAPIWGVHEVSTSKLLKSFYQHYREGLPIKDALQKAQLKLINSAQYSHPFYWSGLVLTEVPQ